MAKDTLLSAAACGERRGHIGPSAPGFPVSGTPGWPQSKAVARVQYNIRMREVAEAADCGWTSKQISLHLVAHFVLQELQLCVGLDAFRKHREAKSATQA